jgi:hypothetical protein
MAFKMTKIPSITSIFEREDEKNYTDDALELQCIIGYSIVLNKECPETSRDFNRFSVWSLAGWLIDHYPKFRDEFRDLSGRTLDRKKKIQAKFDGIETKVKKLAYLDIIEEIRELSDASKEARYYRFTELGYMVAWIVESFDESKREIANNQIYKTIPLNAKENPSSSDIFYSLLFKKYKDRGVFDNFFTKNLRNKICERNIQIRTMKELFSRAFTHSSDDGDAEVFSKLWRETFDELTDQEMKSYILYSLKLDMEELMESHVKNAKGYEKLRFDLRNHYDVIALEGKCSSCGHPSPISIKIFEYIDRIKLLANNHVNTRCGVCGINSLIDIPRL